MYVATKLFEGLGDILKLVRRPGVHGSPRSAA